MATIGDNLRRLRKAAGLRQGTLASRMRVPQSRVSDIERNRYGYPDFVTVFRVAKALDVSIDELLFGTDAEYDRVVAGVGPRGKYTRMDMPALIGFDVS